MPAALFVVEVAAMPWPWNPFKCRFRAQFESLVQEAGHPSDAERSQLFGHMVLDLRPQERLSCAYHQCDWRYAAETAIWCHRRCVAHNDPDVDRRVRKQGYGEAELHAISSFFVRPISWSPGDATVGNGQHRVCALKCSGAEHCIVRA